MAERFFIFDGMDRIIGNPKGYATHAGAWRGIRRGTKAYKRAWAVADQLAMQNKLDRVPLWSIRAVETA